jgi:hypothetical protein
LSDRAEGGSEGTGQADVVPREKYEELAAENEILRSDLLMISGMAGRHGGGAVRGE